MNTPGHPGITPHWTSSAKSGIGTAINRESRVWFTLSHGIISPGGLLPEQVWDASDNPDRELFNGKPSGSGMPLVWAHSEYLKLVRSLVDGAVFDTPPQPVQRYIKDKTDSPLMI